MKILKARRRRILVFNSRAKTIPASLKEYTLVIAKLIIQFSDSILTPPASQADKIKQIVKLLCSWRNIFNSVVTLLQREDEEYPLSYIEKMTPDKFLEILQNLFLVGCVLYIVEEDPFRKIT